MKRKRAFWGRVCRSIVVVTMLSASSFLPASAPALAQRGVEFGYKDRIFEQKYLLPDGLNAFEVQNYLLMSGLRAMAITGGSGFDSRVLEAAGGTCAGLFVGSQRQ